MAGARCLDEFQGLPSPSGSSDHITNNATIFTRTSVASQGEAVVSVTGSTATLARGKVSFSVNTPTGQGSAQLEGVLFSPDYATNVLSLAKILDKGFLVDFSSGTIANSKGHIQRATSLSYSDVKARCL